MPVIHNRLVGRYRCNRRYHPGRCVPVVFPPLVRSIVSRCTDFLGLRLVIHGVPLLGLVGGHDPLALPELLRLAVRHDGFWRRINGCRVVVGDLGEDLVC